jgi:hypothetical protein
LTSLKIIPAAKVGKKIALKATPSQHILSLSIFVVENLTVETITIYHLSYHFIDNRGLRTDGDQCWQRFLDRLSAKL